MKKFNLVKCVVVGWAWCIAVSGVHGQDALDNLDTGRAANLARQVNNSQYSDRGKAFGNANRDSVMEAGGSEPEIEVGRNYTEERGDQINTLYTGTRADREAATTKVRSDSSLLGAELAVTSGVFGLGESYEDCVDIGSKPVVESTTGTCSVLADYEEMRFECTKSGFNVCENMTARRLNGDRGEISLVELGIALVGANNDSERPYTVMETTGEFVGENATDGRCETSEYLYQLVVPQTGQLVELGLKMESFIGQVEVTINDAVVFESGDASACNADGDPPFTIYENSNAEVASIIASLNGESNLVRVRYTHPENAPLRFSFDGYGREPCIESEYVTVECPAEISMETRSNAALVDESCIQPVDNVIYMDRVIETDCIQWLQQYEVIKGPFYSGTAECDDYVAQGCDLIASKCTSEGQAYCPEYSRTYRCDSVISTEGETVSVCADTLACRGGECAEEFQAVPDNQEDFKEASIWVEILGGMDSDINLDGGDTNFFTGRATRCEDYVAGFGNCCADSGWGLSLGLMNCSREEIDLGYAKQDGRAISVGRDRDEIDLGIFSFTVVDYKVYCVFDSPVARVFMQQANAQLNRGFGSGGRPNCQGLNLDQMASLDFSRMDFSELYPGAGSTANTVPPDVDGLIQRVSNADPCQFSAAGDCNE